MTHVPKERGARVIAELHAVPWGQRAHAYGIGDHHVHDAGFDLLGRLARCLREPVDDRERSEALDLLFGTLLHQGTTYGATCDAVPFVIAYLADADDGDWSQWLWIWLGFVVGSARLPSTLSGSRAGPHGPGVRERLLAAFRNSFAVMRPPPGSRFADLAELLKQESARDEAWEWDAFEAWDDRIEHTFRRPLDEHD